MSSAEINNNPQKKRNIPFIEILKQAASIVWQNRFLLWFGLLMALGSPGSFNIGRNENWANNSESVSNFFKTHWQIVVAIALALFIIGIILFLISLIAKAGLVKSVNLISQNKKTNFKEGWGSGKKYLSKLFGISVLFFLATFFVAIVLVVPVIYLALNKFLIGSISVGLLAVAIFIPFIFVLLLTKIFAEFYIILSDLRLRSAIEAGYELLLKNIGNSIIFGLLLFAVSLAAGIILLPVAGIALVILIPTGAIFYYLNKIIFGFFLAVAVLIFLAAILFVSSIFQTFDTAAWTLFFREIAKVEKPETETVLEEEIQKHIAATPASPPTSSKLQ